MTVTVVFVDVVDGSSVAVAITEASSGAAGAAEAAEAAKTAQTAQKVAMVRILAVLLSCTCRCRQEYYEAM